MSNPKYPPLALSKIYRHFSRHRKTLRSREFFLGHHLASFRISLVDSKLHLHFPLFLDHSFSLAAWCQRFASKQVHVCQFLYLPQFPVCCVLYLVASFLSFFFQPSPERRAPEMGQLAWFWIDDPLSQPPSTRPTKRHSPRPDSERSRKGLNGIQGMNRREQGKRRKGPARV